MNRAWVWVGQSAIMIVASDGLDRPFPVTFLALSWAAFVLFTIEDLRRGSTTARIDSTKGE